MTAYACEGQRSGHGGTPPPPSPAGHRDPSRCWIIFITWARRLES
ncbi:hypothetical protein MSS4_03398 [Mycobacterium marinum]|nr:hypothetical protein MSS4_03398 [Mycobacterium marinum]